MKKYILLSVCLCIYGLINAQVGIGTTTPNPSSVLDISATDKGVLIPQISLNSVANTMLDGLNTSATGLLIYNTNSGTIGGSGVGYYYFNGTIWERLTTSATSTGDFDWYEENTTTGPDDINDDIYTLGNVAIGKNTADWPLELQSSAGGRGLSILMDGTSDVTTYGLLSEVTSTASTASLVGLFGRILADGNGEQRGIHSLLNGSGTGIHYGVLSELSGSGTGNQYGNGTIITNTGNGSNFGSYNIISGAGSGAHQGFRSELSGAGTGTQVGSRNLISNVGDGDHWGVYNNLYGTGNGVRYGIQNVIYNAGDGDHFGSYNRLYGFGSGSHTGIRNEMTGTGVGIQYGIQNIITNSGNAAHFGILNQLSGTGTATHYGVRNELTGDGTGDQEGMSTLISNTNDASHFGINTRLSGNGNGSHWGMLVNLTSTGSGFQTGMRSNLSGGTGNLTGYWTEFSGSLGDGNQLGAFTNYFAGGNGILAGAYTQIQSSVTGTGTQYGYFSSNDSPGGGLHYGVSNWLTGTGSGIQYGVQNNISNSGDAMHYGNYNVLNGSGSGDHFGIYNSLTANGSGAQYGVFNNLSGSAASYKYGVRNEIDVTDSSGIGTSNYITGISNGGQVIGTANRMEDFGSSDQFGTVTTFVVGNGGIQYGSYINNTSQYNGTTSPQYGYYSTSTGLHNSSVYGIRNNINKNGTGNRYGSYNRIEGTGSGGKYGFYANMVSTAGGNHYGVYSLAAKAGSYAGFFLGNVFVSGVFTNPSDRNLKNNIRETPSVIEQVNNIQVRDFSFKAELAEKYGFPRENQTGYIAQELEAIFPNLVKTETLTESVDDDGTTAKTVNFRSVNYIGMVPILTKAIQEQQQIIENQQSEMDVLKNEIKAIKAILGIKD